MNNMLAAGLIAGSVIGAAGVTWALSDQRARDNIARGTNKIVQATGDLAGGMIDSITH